MGDGVSGFAVGDRVMAYTIFLAASATTAGSRRLRSVRSTRRLAARLGLRLRAEGLLSTFA